MTCLMTEKRQGSLQIFEGYKCYRGSNNILKSRREKPIPLGLIEPNFFKGKIKVEHRKYLKLRFIIL